MPASRTVPDVQAQLDELEEIYRSAPVGLSLVDTEFFKNLAKGVRGEDDDEKSDLDTPRGEKKSKDGVFGVPNTPRPVGGSAPSSPARSFSPHCRQPCGAAIRPRLPTRAGRSPMPGAKHSRAKGSRGHPCRRGYSHSQRRARKA